MDIYDSRMQYKRQNDTHKHILFISEWWPCTYNTFLTANSFYDLAVAFLLRHIVFSLIDSQFRFCFILLTWWDFCVFLDAALFRLIIISFWPKCATFFYCHSATEKRICPFVEKRVCEISLNKSYILIWLIKRCV